MTKLKTIIYHRKDNDMAKKSAFLTIQQCLSFKFANQNIRHKANIKPHKKTYIRIFETLQTTWNTIFEKIIHYIEDIVQRSKPTYPLFNTLNSTTIFWNSLMIFCQKSYSTYMNAPQGATLSSKLLFTERGVIYEKIYSRCMCLNCLFRYNNLCPVLCKTQWWRNNG